MKLCRFGKDQLGLVEGDEVIDVSAALDVIPPQTWPIAMGDPLYAHLDAVRARVGEVKAAGTRHALADVALLSPVATPSKVMAAPVNYRKHFEIDVKTDPGVDQGVHIQQLEGVERPTEKFGLFLKAGSSVVGPSEGVRIIRPDRRTDHEIELCLVIGKTCANVTRDEAMDYVAGYMLGLDMTLRGQEDRSFRKSPDSYTVFGPWFTSADEIADCGDLEIWLDVNGAHRQRTSTQALTVDVPDLIEIASNIYTLHPGDVIMTGTPEGVGPVKPGDVITAGGTGLGEITVKTRD
ncbi:MAG: fumarylacetoacetate hydrolase family protein [Pseudomonadota bacterium]|nr:fumarylacetoacetate hydrolase family protein [Pseudomonadota bacterium]